MGLNIKNEDAHRLAVEVAKLTGETLTEAVIKALAERLEKIKAEQDEERLFRELIGLAEKCAAGLKGPPIDHGEFLYDERGLPHGLWPK